MTITLASQFVVEECCHKGCGISFAVTVDFQRRCLNDHARSFYCPNGHGQHYTGKTDAQKLQDAQARETALRDQLTAAIRDGERTRQQLMRDRERFSKGVCPCCNRSFDNVRRHMASKHPDYDTTQVARPVRYACSCGRKFDTYHGLRIHQTRQRSGDWDKPGQPDRRSHLTAGAIR